MDTQDSRIPVVLAFTPSFLVPAAVCIQSLLHHSGASDRYHIICLLSQPLSRQAELKLLEMDKHRLQFTFINLEDKVTDIDVPARYTGCCSLNYCLILSVLYTLIVILSYGIISGIYTEV